MGKYMDVVHELFVDNFYTSTPLTKALLARKANVVWNSSSKLAMEEVIRRRNSQMVVLKAFFPIFISFKF